MASRPGTLTWLYVAGGLAGAVAVYLLVSAFSPVFSSVFHRETHTGVMRSYTDAIYFPFQSPYSPIPNAGVAAVAEEDARNLWGENQPGDGAGYNVPEASPEAWREFAQLTRTGSDGSFDLELTPGRYWVCLGYLDTSTMDFSAQGCALADLGEKPVLFSTDPSIGLIVDS